MALTELSPHVLSCLMLVLLNLHTVAGMSGWSGCADGNDVFATVKENSAAGEVVAELEDDFTLKGVQWNLSGKDAEWFYLDGNNIRLNTSAENILDREALGPVLMAELLCQDEDDFQFVYRLLVEILNENDNSPMFAENIDRTLSLSELTPVNTVAFTIQATDEDNDKIMYSIDQTSPDAEHFRIDLPNSGEVVLSKPLDYESKTLLTIIIHATEMNTAEHYNTSTNITIRVLDGDDQYPQFQPCVLLFLDDTNEICTSPVYMVNITEGEEDIALDFSPGPVHAVDGDRGLSSSVSYTILSGDDDGHLSMDTKTGEMRLIKGVRDRVITPVLRLQVMAYQDDDPRKYCVATVLVGVLSVNQFYPEFDMDEYHGFVMAGKSQATLVNTYGSKALVLNVQDQDFDQGFNPMIYFNFSATSNHTDIYQVTQGGLIIARPSRVKPKQKHVLEVAAIDQESGDAAFATVVVEVLPEGHQIPYSPLGVDRLSGCTVGKALFLSMVFMAVFGCFFIVMMWLRKKHKGRRDPLERGCVAQGKHPNVSLRWFQLESHHSAMPHMEEVPYINEEYGTCNPSFSFPDKPELKTTQDIPSNQEPTPLQAAASDILPPAQIVCSPVILNNKTSTPTKISTGTPTFSPSEEELSPAALVQEDVQLKGHLDSPRDVTPEPCEEKPYPGFGSTTSDDTEPSPSHNPDLQTTTFADVTEPVPSSSSPSSSECSHIQMASAETDTKTPPQSPLLSSPLLEDTATPPPSPEHGLLKATLVLIEASPTDTPPETPEQSSETLMAESEQPSTSLDHSDPSESEGGTGDNESPSHSRTPLTVSGSTHGEGSEDEDGFHGDEDADKNSEGPESERMEDRRWSM